MTYQTGLRCQPRRQKEVDQNGFPQISARFLSFDARCARGLHSATKLAGFIRSKPRKQQQIWSRDKQFDLNTARKDQLLSLPGATAAEADRVIVGRPYNEPGEVVTRRIMPKTEYDKIADRVTAKK
jgi:hypothetical protein